MYHDPIRPHSQSPPPPHFRLRERLKSQCGTRGWPAIRALSSRVLSSIRPDFSSIHFQISFRDLSPPGGWVIASPANVLRPDPVLYLTAPGGLPHISYPSRSKADWGVYETGLTRILRNSRQAPSKMAPPLILPAVQESQAKDPGMAPAFKPFRNPLLPLPPIRADGHSEGLNQTPGDAGRVQVSRTQA